MDVLTYRYYVIDSTLLMFILVTLCVLDVLTYLAALFAETPAFVDCKVTKCIRKKNSLFFPLMIEDVQVLKNTGKRGSK